MFGIVLIIVGIVLLVRKKVALTKNKQLIGKDARNLGWFCLLYGAVPLFIPASPLTENMYFFLGYFVVFFIVLYWFIKKPHTQK